MRGPKGVGRKRRSSPRDVVSWSTLFWCTLFVVINCALFSGFSFYAFRFLFGKTFQPVLVLTWPAPSNKPISPITISVREVVMFPDQALVFLNNYPRTAHVFTKDDLHCVYFSANDSSRSQPRFNQPPIDIDGGDFHNQIVRCPLPPRRLTVSVGLKHNDDVPVLPSYSWDWLAYDALVDRDNTTIVFVKGLNLRRERISNTEKFECVYGWDFRTTRFLLRSDVVSIAQEIVRCKTPLSVLSFPRGPNNTLKVSVRVKGGGAKGILDTIARPAIRPGLANPTHRKEHEMCLCSMVRNQGRFLKEWVMYHAQMGVQRWFLYDNNSDDDSVVVIEWLRRANYNVTRHAWPWLKTQEAGFAHCALRARETCQWVGFIDVDEFFHLPSGLCCPTCCAISPIMTMSARSGPRATVLGLRASDEFLCKASRSGSVGYKSLQVPSVGGFKEKFYRRVATYVADWQEEQNVGLRIGPRDWGRERWSHGIGHIDFVRLGTMGLEIGCCRVLLIHRAIYCHGKRRVVMEWYKCNNSKRLLREV
ncbi:hypothetical protein Pyn_12093 [Prunus yedoensis var. nudiflora]|uniref:Glycosyltransferase family 92 protein n=1 Tax=Prunus yedoensis var. nudiflora TaxID=2094558 RepID=A0A314Z5Y6_PRUYE|nr:hypothetical protein Pyn_12093 [Prunus yedoensis var. nudiflora]